MKPNFPIVQIDIEKWDIDLMVELFRFDEFYYSGDNEFYDHYFYNKQFLDSDGRIFLAREKIKASNFWSKLGVGKKYLINYQVTGKQWTFEEVKSFLISKVTELSSYEGRDQWISSLKSAKTIKQLIEAER